MTKCGANEKKNRVAACAYICEMTHGYENAAFFSLVRIRSFSLSFPYSPIYVINLTSGKFYRKKTIDLISQRPCYGGNNSSYLIAEL